MTEPSDKSPAPLFHPAALAIDQLLRDCDARRQRRSGPGGQHRNKVETAVVLVHRPTGIHGEASERRSQEANRQVALFRLRVKLALEIRMPVEASAPPSPAWQSRIRNGRISLNPRHDDFPTLLSEALDRIIALQADVVAAAERLGITTSQLVGLLRKEPAALTLVNRKRRESGLHPLK